MNSIAETRQPIRSLDIIQGIKRALIHRGLHSGEEKTVTSVTENTPEEKLMYTTTESQDILFKANTISPFSFFRDTIEIDREKLTIVRRSSFRTADIISVQICDILNVEVRVGPLFGSLILSSKFFINTTQAINYLSRKDVIKCQRLIQGSIIANRKKIDYSSIEKGQLIALLADMGQGATT
ncbi:MAG TPA: hypothetical protein VMR34_04090 [Candidatus Saccharimonadales bacterium]|nr:hypothetical protein [Candidatus Saccharimonadales bacterium]